MGLASYFIMVSDVDPRSKAMALVVYSLQLAMNFMWSIVFFNWTMYLFAFIWLMVMWCIVIVCAFRFWPINRLAAYLLMPYILWLTFAAYLNMGAYSEKADFRRFLISAPTAGLYLLCREVWLQGHNRL